MDRHLDMTFYQSGNAHVHDYSMRSLQYFTRYAMLYREYLLRVNEMIWFTVQHMLQLHGGTYL